MSAPLEETKGQTKPKDSLLNDYDVQDTKAIGPYSSDESQDISNALDKMTSNRGTFKPTLTIPPRVHRTSSSDTLSLISADDFSELRQAHSTSDEAEQPPPSEETPSGWRGKIYAYWLKQKGLVLVLVAQLFGTLMNVTARLLEEQGDGMHPFQIIWTRMTITCVLSSLYMWYQQIPDFPLGAKSVRPILLARGFGGFFGVFGLYWSLQYLDLSDATVLTFIAPMFSCWICAKLLKEPFTRTEQIGAMISLAGVFLIARPAAIFSSSGSSTSASGSSPQPRSPDNSTSSAANDDAPAVTPELRLAAVGMALVGVAGATTAYITIRWIGKRAHSLISVNYFAASCVIVSSVVLAFVPSIPFRIPSTTRQWLLLIYIGVSGFLMQFLLTAGLRYEKSSRATNMVYSQMLFAVAFDKLIWGTTPGWLSMAGSGLILGSAIVVALQKEGFVLGNKQADDEEAHVRSIRGNTDEEAGLVQGGENAVQQQEEETQAQAASESVPHSSRSSADLPQAPEESGLSTWQRLKTFFKFTK